MKAKILIIASLLFAGIFSAQNFNVKDFEKIIDLQNETIDKAISVLKKLKCKSENEGDFRTDESIAMNNPYKCATIQEDRLLLSAMKSKIVAIYYIELEEKDYVAVENMLLNKKYTTTNEIEEMKPDRELMKVKVFESPDKKPDAHNRLENTKIILQQPVDGKFSVYIN